MGRIILDADRHLVWLERQRVELDHLEFRLLHALMAAQGRVLTHAWLLENVWEHNPDVITRTVSVYIRCLRRKLGHEAKRIVTVRQVGYRLDVE